MNYYESNEGAQGSHIPFNFLLMGNVNKEADARDIAISIQTWLTYMPRHQSANWVMGNHDNPRIASRLGAENVDIINMLLMSLPGIAVTYNASEIITFVNQNLLT